MKQNRIHIIFALLFALALVACTTDTTCRKDMSVCALMTLKADSLDTKGHSVKYTTWDNVSIRPIENEMYILYNNKNVKEIPLFLQPDTNLTAFLLTYHNQTDTLFVAHTPLQYFVSLACGCAVYHTINKAWSTDSRVDSVQIINASVENTMQESLRIYLHE